MKRRRPRIVFVCTGNVCRSPMAEYLFRAQIQTKQDWDIRSAGVATVAGMCASPPAVQVLLELGLDLTPHRSRPVTADLVDSSYMLVTMTRAHRDILVDAYPATRDKAFPLMSFVGNSRDEDVPDPIGSTVAVYMEVRDQIRSALPGLQSFIEHNLQST